MRDMKFLSPLSLPTILVPVLLATAVPSVAVAQEPQSAAPVKELAQLLTSKKLASIAARMVAMSRPCAAMEPSGEQNARCMSISAEKAKLDGCKLVQQGTAVYYERDECDEYHHRRARIDHQRHHDQRGEVQ